MDKQLKQDIAYTVGALLASSLFGAIAGYVCVAWGICGPALVSN